MKQQTAVEWLIDQIKEHKKKFGIPPTEKGYMNLIEQTKQMETEQMKEVYIQACFDSITYEITDKIKAEQYYNKTFNK